MENLPTPTRKPPAFRRPAIVLDGPVKNSDSSSFSDATDGAHFRKPMAPVQMTISPGNAANDDKLAAKLKRLELSRKKSSRSHSIELKTPSKVDLVATERLFVETSVENIPQTPLNHSVREPFRTPSHYVSSMEFPRDSMRSNATYVLSTPRLDRGLHPHNDPFTPAMTTPSRKTNGVTTPLAYDEKLERQFVALSSWANVILDSASFVSEIDLGTSKQDASRKLQEMLTKQNKKNGVAETMKGKYTDLCLRKKCLDYLKRADSVYQSTPIPGMLKSMVEKGEISIKPNIEVYANIGIQTSILSLLFSLHPFWLFIGVETVCAEFSDHDTISLDGRLPFSSSSFAPSTVRFIHDHILANSKYMSKKKFAIGTVKKIVTDKGREVLHKHCITCILSMAVLLEYAKNSYLFENTPGLFVKNSEIKTVSDFCTEFSRLVLSASGTPLNKAFDKHCFRRSYRQSFLEEYQYAMKSVRDMADGIILGRLIELLTDSSPLSIIGNMRNPQGDRIRKKGNVEKALSAASEAGIDVDGISIDQILAAHRESCLDLMWRLVGVYVKKKAEQEPLRRESLCLEGGMNIDETNDAMMMMGAPLGGIAESAFAVYQQLAFQFGLSLSKWADLEDGVLVSSIWQHYNPTAPDIRFYDGESLFDKVANAADSDLGIPIALTALRDERQLGLFAHMFLSRLISFKKLRDSEMSDGESDASSIVSIIRKEGENLSEETLRIQREFVGNERVNTAREDEERLKREEEKRREDELRRRFEEEEEERLNSEWRSPPRSPMSVEIEEKMLMVDGEEERIEEEMRREIERMREDPLNEEKMKKEEEERERMRLIEEGLVKEEEESREKEKEKRRGRVAILIQCWTRGVLAVRLMNGWKRRRNERLQREEEERRRIEEEVRSKAEEERQRREEEERQRLIEEARLEEIARLRAEDEERLQREKEEEERLKMEEEERKEDAAIKISSWICDRLAIREAKKVLEDRRMRKREEEEEMERLRIDDERRRKESVGRIESWYSSILSIRAARAMLMELREERWRREEARIERERIEAEERERQEEEARQLYALMERSAKKIQNAYRGWRLIVKAKEELEGRRREERERLEMERLRLEEEERIRREEEARLEMERIKREEEEKMRREEEERMRREEEERMRREEEEKMRREEGERMRREEEEKMRREEEERMRREEEERMRREEEERMRREEEERMRREEEERMRREEEERMRREEEERIRREEEARLEIERLKREEEDRLRMEEEERLKREERVRIERERLMREERRTREEEARLEIERIKREEEEKRLRDEEEARFEIERQLEEERERLKREEMERIELERMEKEDAKRREEDELREWAAKQKQAQKKEEMIYEAIVAEQERDRRLGEIREKMAARTIQKRVRGWLHQKRIDRRTVELLERLERTPRSDNTGRMTIGAFSEDRLNAGVREIKRRQRKLSLTLYRMTSISRGQAATRIQAWWRGIQSRRRHRVEIELIGVRVREYNMRTDKILNEDSTERAIPVSRRLERARNFLQNAQRLYDIKVACYTTMSLCRLSSLYCERAIVLDLHSHLIDIFLLQADRSPAYVEIIEFGVHAIEEMVKCSSPRVRDAMVKEGSRIVQLSSHQMMAFYHNTVIVPSAMKILRMCKEILPVKNHPEVFGKIYTYYLKKAEEKFGKLPSNDPRSLEFAELKGAFSI